MSDVLVYEPCLPLTAEERGVLRNAREILIVNADGEVIARSDDPLAIGGAMVAIKRPLQAARGLQDSPDCELPAGFK